MHVQMKNRLAGARPYIQHCPVTIFDSPLPRYLRCRQMAVSDDLRLLGGCLLQSANVLLRNYKYVSGCFGVDVFEGECVLIFEDLLGGNFPGNDAAE